MIRQKQILVALVLLPLILLLAYLKFQQRQRLWGLQKQQQEAERASKTRDDPLPYVNGMTVAEVRPDGPRCKIRALTRNPRRYRMPSTHRDYRHKMSRVKPVIRPAGV